MPRVPGLGEQEGISRIGMAIIPPRARATEPIPPGAIDIDCFRRVTAALMRCAETAGDRDGGPQRHERLSRAVYDNMALWGEVLHEMLRGRRSLPEPLRAQLTELAEVSIRHCSHVLRGDAAIDPLIAVNRSIIDGLQPGGAR